MQETLRGGTPLLFRLARNSLARLKQPIQRVKDCEPFGTVSAASATMRTLPTVRLPESPKPSLRHRTQGSAGLLLYTTLPDCAFTAFFGTTAVLHSPTAQPMQLEMPRSQ